MSKITNALNKAMKDRNEFKTPGDTGVKLGESEKSPWGWIALVVGILFCVGGMVWWESAKVERRARAMYEEGLALIEEGRSKEGQAQLLHFVETQPLSEWSDDALWAISRAQLAEGDKGGSHHTQQRLIATYPESSWIQELAKKPSLATEIAKPAVPELIAESPVETAKKAKAEPKSEPVAVASAPIPAEPSFQFYEVKRGDTLSKIAKRFGTTVASLRQTNGISGDLIRPKQKLKIASN